MAHVLAFFYFLAFLGFLSCSGPQSDSTRQPAYTSTVTPIYGPNTFTGTKTSTQTSTSTETSTGTGTFVNPQVSLLDNSPVPSLLATDGQILTSDRPSDCPNSVCTVTVSSVVTSALATYTSTTTNTSNAPITFSLTAAPIRNYFKTVCMVTHLIDLYQPIYWQTCSTVSGEAFLLEVNVSDNRYVFIHPASRTDLCIEAPGTIVTGLQLDLNTCNNSDAQQWSLEHTTNNASLFSPKSFLNQLCMVRGGNVSGDQTLGLWTCGPNTMMLWTPFE